MLDAAQIAAVQGALGGMCAWPAVGNKEFCRNASSANMAVCSGNAEAVDRIRFDLRRFREEEGLTCSMGSTAAG